MLDGIDYLEILYITYVWVRLGKEALRLEFNQEGHDLIPKIKLEYLDNVH